MLPPSGNIARVIYLHLWCFPPARQTLIPPVDYYLAQPLTKLSPGILSRTSGDVSRAEFEARFEALQAEVRRMRESETEKEWPASPPTANAGGVSVSVALGHAAESQGPPPSVV
jgi:hypothetical protein